MTTKSLKVRSRREPIRVPRSMDPPCIPLFHALNKLPGIRTTSSCCGHGKKPFRMWLEACTLSNVTAVVRRIDGRYLGFEWRCLAYINESAWRTSFCLESLTIGEEAYQESRVLAQSLLDDMESRKRDLASSRELVKILQRKSHRKCTVYGMANPKPWAAA